MESEIVSIGGDVDLFYGTEYCGVGFTMGVVSSVGDDDEEHGEDDEVE